jgi:Fe-S-cluster containining protein
LGKINDDDYCDIYEKKICDNCGKCLELDGVDIKAINIEDIAKTVEENKVLEEDYKIELESQSDITEEDEDLELINAYKSLNEEDYNLNEDEEYEDAFDHIEYLEDDDLFDENNLEDRTIEVFPGVRKLKINDKK